MFLFFLAITEFLIGLAINIISALGIDIADKTPPLEVAFASIFAVLIPTILIGLTNRDFRMLQQSVTQNSMDSITTFNIITKENPVWLKTIVWVSNFYAIINFIFLFQIPLGSFDFKDGQYLLVDHGSVRKVMTEQEYHSYRADLVRILSGFCLGFYANCAAMLFAFNKKEKKAFTINDNTGKPQ